MNRALVPSSALLWGLQVAFLSPALASVLVPALADRRRDYLRPMLGCGLLTLVLVVLSSAAGVGSSLLFAPLHQSGAQQAGNAGLFAAIAGVGLPLFEQLIPRPGLSTGRYTNTRRIGAIMSGPIIASGSLTALAERGIFVGCAVPTAAALAVVGLVGRTIPGRDGPEAEGRPA